MKNHNRFLEGLNNLKISYDEEQLNKLDIYFDMLIEKNKVMNLTAIVEYDEVVSKHFIDSLSVIKAYPEIGTKELKIIDIGTGAGFPGIPLKIMFPKLNITLMDSLNKRINFLNEVIKELKLENITAVHERAEEAARKPEYRQAFDICVSRAVARFVSLAELCMPFVIKNGCFISYKSGKAREELKEAEFAVKTLGGKLKECLEFELTGTDMERAFIVIKKCSDTPKCYPRAGGKPFKAPLVKNN